MTGLLLPTHIMTHAASINHMRDDATRRAMARAGNRFDFHVKSVGKTHDERVEVWYDATYGHPCQQVARDVLAQLPTVMAMNDELFGVTGKAGNVIVAALVGQTDGSTGAYHYRCSFNDQTFGGSDWYCDLAVGNSPMVLGLAQAEISESYMGLQNKGWDCGGSNGEGLSRVLAQDVSGGPWGTLLPYYTASLWIEEGCPDFFNVTEPTDQNVISTGCAVLYLYWLRHRGVTTSAIVKAGCPNGTLASNYASLFGSSDGWGNFLSTVKKLPPFTGDDPWTPKPDAPALAGRV